MALTFESFFVDIPSVSPDTTLIFYNNESPYYRRNVSLLLGSREENMSKFLRPVADETTEERFARALNQIKEDLGDKFQEDKYLLVPRPPTDNKMLNEIIEGYFDTIAPFIDEWSVGPSEVFYIDNPKEPEISRRKREVLEANSTGKFSDVKATPISSILSMYRKMSRDAPVYIFLTPSERKAINPRIFLGHPVEEFSTEQLKALRLTRVSLFLSEKPTPHKVDIISKKLEELAVEVLMNHTPESFLRVTPSDDISIITDDPKLVSLAEGKGWHSVEVFSVNPHSGWKVAFVGSPEKFRQYSEAIIRFDLEDLGLVSREESFGADIVVVDKKDDDFFRSLLAQRKEIWLLDQLLEAPPTAEGCSSLEPEPQGSGILRNENEKVNCDDFLTDRLYRHPALPVPLPHPIDEKKAQEWVATHPMKYREMARDFIRSTHHVSFDDFYANLRRSTLAALERIGDRPFALLILAEDEKTKKKSGWTLQSALAVSSEIKRKSNYWVSQLIWDFFDEKKKFPSIVTDSMAKAFLEYPQIRDFVVADDASYSGAQMRDTVEEQLEITLRSLIFYQKELTIPERKIFFGLHKIAECDRNEIASMFNIHVVIPYMSMEAKKIIPPDCRYKCYLRIFFYDQVIMRRLSEIVGRDYVEEMVKKDFIDGDKWPYYFDHKVADGVSTYPRKYRYGHVAGSKRSIVFLENCFERGCYGSYYKNLF